MSKGPCRFCGKEVDSRGLKSHEAFCPLRIHAKGEGQPAPDIDFESMFSQKLDELKIEEMLSQRVDEVVNSLLEMEDNGQVGNMEEMEELIEEVKGLAEKLDGNDPKEIAGLVSREIDNQLGPLLDRVEEQSKQLGQWVQKRDKQVGEHLNDLKRSVDAQNARIAQAIHRMDAWDATSRELISTINSIREEASHAAEAFEKTPPPEVQESEAPIEESEPASAKNELPVGVCEGDEKHWFDEGERAGGLKTCPVDKTAINWNLLYGQCAGNKRKGVHFMEKGEAQQRMKFCTECGAEVVWYPSPKKLKTKPTV